MTDARRHQGRGLGQAVTKPYQRAGVTDAVKSLFATKQTVVTKPYQRAGVTDLGMHVRTNRVNVTSQSPINGLE